MSKPDKSPSLHHEVRDDYADERVPIEFRQWSNTSIFGVMFGITTAMIFLSWGGILVRQFGTVPLTIGMILSTLIIGTSAVLFSIRASKTGLGAELLSRSAGFGFLGTLPIGLIYGFALIMYFAAEGGIMVNTVHAYFNELPRTTIILFAAFAFIPLTIYGMKIMNFVMWITLPFYLIFIITTIVIAAQSHSGIDFWSYVPKSVDTAAGPPVLQILAASLGFGTQVALSADTGRLIDPKRATSGAMLVGGLSQVLVFMVCTMLGAWLALQFDEADPGLYLPEIMGIWGVLFVIITQARINVVNVYGASIALANVGSRISRRNPSRSFWVMIVIAIGTVAMLTDLYGRLAEIMTFAAIFLFAWVMTVIADLLIVRKLLKMVPEDSSPYSLGDLPNFNPAGMSALTIAVLVGTPLGLGIAGPVGVTAAPFASGVIPILVVPIVAWITDAKGYRARSV